MQIAIRALKYTGYFLAYNHIFSMIFADRKNDVCFVTIIKELSISYILNKIITNLLNSLRFSSIDLNFIYTVIKTGNLSNNTIFAIFDQHFSIWRNR